MSTASAPMPHRVTVERAVLVFDVVGVEYRIPAITRDQWARALALEAPPAGDATSSATEPFAESSEDFAKASRRFAKATPRKADGERDLEACRAGQLAIFAERSAPPLPVESLSPAARDQMLWALVAQYHQLHPAHAAAVAAALRAAHPAPNL